MTTIVDNLWLRINALVPEPQCTTQNNDYDSVVWKDARPKPAASALLSVDIVPILSDIESKQATRLQALGELKSLAILSGKTDAQISAYADSLTISDPEAKKLFKLLLRAVGALSRDRGVV